MDRRQFLRNILLSGAALALPGATSSGAGAATFSLEGKRVYGAVIGGGDLVPQVWSPKLLDAFYKGTVFDGC